jgi:hypothetical protein
VTGDDLPFVLLLSKPFVYVWTFELLRRSLPRPGRPSGWASVGGGVARAFAGLVFGIPAFMLLLSLGPVGAGVGLFAVRALFWAGTAGLVFPPLDPRRGLVFGLAGAALNTVFDLTLFGAYPADLRRFCC